MAKDSKKRKGLDSRLTIRLSAKELEWLTELCKNEDDFPSRQKMVRRLITKAFAEFMEEIGGYVE